MPSKPTEDFLAVAGELTTRELARRFKQTEDVIRRWRSDCGIAAPEPKVRVFARPVLRLQNFILTSDWHVPYHDPNLIEEVLQASVDWGIKDVIAAGDVIDLPTISRFDARDIDSTVGMELSMVGDVLYQFGRAGLHVHWSRGNHELRYFKALKHQVDIQDLIKSTVGEVDFVTGYEAEELVVFSGGEKWLITHPNDYSFLPLTIARRLSEKYECNVAAGHSHHYSFGHSPSGNVLLDTGGLFDPEKLAYLWRGGATKFPQQQPGFWVISNGSAVMP